jgi:hypothetical protein
MVLAVIAAIGASAVASAFPALVKQTISREMTLELTDEEHRALVRLLRRSIDEDRFPLAPRHAPIRAILAKLEPPTLKPEQLPPLKPGMGPSVGRGRRRP